MSVLQVLTRTTPIRAASIVCTTAALSACGWFASEEPAQRISPLVEIASPVTATAAWTRDLGGKAESVVLKPAVDGGRLFVANTKGDIQALDATSGGAAWQTDVGAGITGGVGVGAGLVLVGTEEGGVVAVDERDGSVRWRAKMSSEVLSAPVAAAGVVAVRTNDGKVAGLNVADGSQLWSFEREPPVLSLRGTGSPVVAGNTFICGMDGGKLVSLDVNTGLPLWEVSVAYPTGRSDLDRVVDIDGDPFVVGNGVFVSTFQGHMAAVDRETGGIVWSQPFSSYNGFAANRQSLFTTDETGIVYAVEPTTGSPRWKQKELSGRRLTGPAGVGGFIAVGDLEGYVHWIDPASGNVVGRNKVADSPIRAAPVAADGLVYFLGSEGEVAALRPPAGG